MRRFGSARFWLIAAIVVLLAVLGVLLKLFLDVAEPPAVVKIEPDGMQWVQSIYGYGPSDAEQFQGVYSVALGPDGDIYATDPGRSRILVFSRFGEYKRTIETGGDGTGASEFKRPAAIHVDNLGRLYVADSALRKIVVFAEDGEFLREWPVASQARGVDVEAGEVYVLGEGVVYVYDLSGVLLRQWGSRGKAPGQIDAYQGIVVDQGRVYIADAYNKRIQAFDTNGTLAWANPSAGAEVSFETTALDDAGETFGWDLPQDLTLDGAGRLVVIDAFRFEVVVVDASDGTVVESFGDFGTAEGEFFYPTSIEYDRARDRFVVADTQNRRVQIVTLPGSSGDAAAVVAMRRMEASPARFLAAPLLVLVTLLLFALVQWKRWGRAAAGDVG